MVPFPQAVEDAVACQFLGVKASQPTIGTEHRDAGIAGSWPALVAVAIADHATAVAKWEAVSQEPFEGTPGRMNFHRCFQLRIVCVFYVGISTADMGVDQAVFILQRLE